MPRRVSDGEGRTVKKRQEVATGETGNTDAGVDRREFIGTAGLVAGAMLAPMAAAEAKSTQREITGWDANTLSARIGARDVSCVEVMDAYLAQIRRLNPKVNAIVAMVDEEKLRGEAQERDRQLARGESLGWMHGMPQAIKDTSHAKGIVYTTGSPLFKGTVSTFDSVITERAKASGAIIIGKTNVPEFALGSNTFNPVYGTTWNPYNLRKTVGGSSGGAGAALAAHMLPVADGSDMGGSIRNPSAWTNNYGLRPGAGTVPFAPSPETMVQQFAIEGPMGRTVKDVAMLLSVQAGHDPRAPLSVNLDPKQFTGNLDVDVKGKRIAWLGDWNGYFAMDPGVLDLCKSTLKVFAGLGCVVEEALPDFSAPELWDMWLTHRAWIMGNSLGDFYANPKTRALLSDNARWEVERSMQPDLTANKVFQSSISRTAWVQTVRQFFEKYDFAIAPTTQVFPFDAVIPWPKVVGGRTMETYHQWMGVVLPWTLAGTPVMNAPAGFSADGLPMGIQIIGKRQAEMAVLQMARAYEQATGWVQKRPAPLLKA
jgi:amidase